MLVFEHFVRSLGDSLATYDEMPVHCTQELVNARKIEVNDVHCGNTGSFQLDRKVQTFVAFFSCIIDVVVL